jgi:hypothetical protein
MVTSFKLLQLDGVMRKFTYDGPGRPSWNYVANKVSDLFGIPQNQVAVRGPFTRFYLSLAHTITDFILELD